MEKENVELATPRAQSEAPPEATYSRQGIHPTVYSVPCTARSAAAPASAAGYCRISELD